MDDRPGGPNPVTQQDVARLAGVSSAVVSYVVNGGPRPVAPATRRRVEQAIAQLRYQPNAAARALRSGATGLIGVVVPTISNPYHAEFLEHLDAAAHARGLSVTIAVTHDDPERETGAVRGLVDRGVRGLVIHPYFNDPALYSAGPPSMPRVLMERSQGVPGFPSLGPDELGGGRMVTRHLIDHGHRRVAIIYGEHPNDRRVDGWRAEMAAAGLPADLEVQVAWGRAGGYEAMCSLLLEPDPPTAVFAASDLLAIGALRAVHEAGLSVPGDVAVACYDGTPEAAYAWPSLTCAQVPFGDMARKAIDLVSGSDPESVHFEFPTTLVLRDSCGSH